MRQRRNRQKKRVYQKKKKGKEEVSLITTILPTRLETWLIKQQKLHREL